jgi:hypothetical protein
MQIRTRQQASAVISGFEPIFGCPAKWLHRLLFAGLLLCVTLSPGSAGAEVTEPTPEAIREAGESFNQGRAAYKEEDYVAAAEHFEKADGLAPNPKVLWLAIDSRERVGHHARAATLAALANQLYPGDPTFEPANELLRVALERSSRLKVECDEPCTVLIDTRLVHGPPMQKRFIFLDPGEYRVRAFWGERSATESYTAVAGASGKLEFIAPPAQASTAVETVPEPGVGSEQPPPVLAPPAAPEANAKPLGPAVFWSGLALTVGLGGVSTWSAIDAEKHPGVEAVRTQCVNQGSDCPAYKEGLRNQLRTNILWGATAGVGVITVLIGAIWTDWGEPTIGAGTELTKQRFPIQPFVWVENGVGVGAVGRF